jgi:hypothetical protein
MDRAAWGKYAGNPLIVVDNPIANPNPQKTIDDLAYETILGEYGRGAERKKLLGENYKAVQERVNELYSIANRVIEGYWGNDEERKKRLEEGLVINEDVLDVINIIAEKIKFNIRELDSALLRVISFSKFKEQPITAKFARELLTDIFSQRDIDISCESVKKAVCKKYNIKISDIESKKRNREFSYPRQIAMYLCRELTDLSLPKIGESFGGRDHTTVLHACDKIKSQIKIDPSLSEDIKNLKEDIQ